MLLRCVQKRKLAVFDEFLRKQANVQNLLKPVLLRTIRKFFLRKMRKVGNRRQFGRYI